MPGWMLVVDAVLVLGMALMAVFFYVSATHGEYDVMWLDAAVAVFLWMGRSKLHEQPRDD